MQPFKRRAKHVKVIPDDVWFDEPSKYRGIVTRIEEAIVNTSATLLLAHYEWTKDAITASLDGLSFVRIVGNDRDLADAATTACERQTGELLIASASNLPIDCSRKNDRVASPTLSILVADRSHSRKADDSILGLAESLRVPSTVQFHTSLDDPIIALFAGEMTLAMLRKLGMTEGDSIQSTMLTRTIAKSQARIDVIFDKLDIYDDRDRLMDCLTAALKVTRSA